MKDDDQSELKMTSMHEERAYAATRCLAEWRNLQCSWHQRSTPANQPTLSTISSDRLITSLYDRPITRSTDPEKRPPTVLYLAYGSNLAARTFKGVRGIKPLSAVNVVVPDLELCFSLPGLPYNEPAFANTRYVSPKPPPPSSSLTASSPSPSRTPPGSQPNKHPPYTNPSWTKGLVGTVYEVTLPDYEHILATEGAGLAYADKVVTCFLLPPGSTTVPFPPSPTLHTKLKAHTLIAPPHNALSRPDPDYAQASLRYLSLLRDGAVENGIPDEYRDYLDELVEYRVTTARQRVGKWVNLMLWSPIIKVLMWMSVAFADEEGRAPEWVRVLLGVVFRLVWVVYDGVFWPVFGDGERTSQSAGDGRDEESGVVGKGEGEEKAALMARYSDDSV